MGVTYKIKPDITAFILKKKGKTPNISCRQMADLVLEQFNVKVSKSSINAIMKEANLSLPVGRRRKRKRGRMEAEGLGVFLLKISDILLGGIEKISGLIKSKLNSEDSQILQKTEVSIFQNLLTAADKTESKVKDGLKILIPTTFTSEEIYSYLNELQQVKDLPSDIIKTIFSLSKEVRCFSLSIDGRDISCIDGQMYSIWSSQNIPYNFATTPFDIKGYIKNNFGDDGSVNLFTAPGYDIPTKELFEMISCLNSNDVNTWEIKLFGNESEILESIQIPKKGRKLFTLALWPWQFAKFRKVKLISEYSQFQLEGLDKAFYLAETEVALLQPNINQTIYLRGCAVKASLEDKIKLVILSNFPKELAINEIALAYLSQWPNLDEGFQDFSKKIELFTYTGTSRRYFSADALNIDDKSIYDVNMALNHYLTILSLYITWHFLPAEYQGKDFAMLYDRFYSLKARLKKSVDRLYLSFLPPVNYQYLKDLDYLCRRLNERALKIGDLRLWCSISISS